VLKADGTYTYTLNNNSLAVQSLAEGQVVTDVFSYSMATGGGNGSKGSSATLTINVSGTNDAATITGTASGNVVEAGGFNNGTPGTPSASGTLTVHDVDSGQASFQAVAAAALIGNYGNFTFNTST